MALSIDDLRSFILVATERSVTKAAAKLGVSQQSVSERVRRLESRLGAKLFTRLAYGMQPSAAGYRFLPYASQCVNLIDQALSAVTDDDLLRIRVQGSVAPAVGPLLEELGSGLNVEISHTDETGTDALFESLVTGSIDVAVGVFPEVSDTEQPNGNGSEPSATDVGVATQALFTDPIVWVAPPSHELALRGQPLPLSELIASRSAVPQQNGGSTPAVDPDGVSFAARSVVAEDLASGRLVELPLDQPSWVVLISIAYRANEHDRPAIVEVRDALVDGHSRLLSRGAAGRSPTAGGAQPST